MSKAGTPRTTALLADLELPGLTEHEQARLTESIREHGLLFPIVVSTGPANPGEIADGRARATICKQLGIDCPQEPRPFATQEEFRLFRLATNLERRQLTDAQRARIGLALLDSERNRAAGRRAQAKGKPRGEKSVPVSRPEQTGEAMAIIARRVGLSPTTFKRAVAVIEHGTPELVGAFEHGRETVNGAHRRLTSEQRRNTRHTLAANLARNPPPLPNARYELVVTDPPWPYQQDKLPYPTQTLEEIGAVPLPGLLADDAVVWLWTTNAFLRAAYQLLDGWGLQPRGVLTWDKSRPGTGHPLMNQTEHCLLATRGNPTFHTTAPTLLRAPAREHSRKPDEFFQIAERLNPDTRRLELYARQRRPGWHAWGAEPDHYPPITDPTSGEVAA